MDKSGKNEFGGDDYRFCLENVKFEVHISYAFKQAE